MNRFNIVIVLSTLLVQSSQNAGISANIILRYENETAQITLIPHNRVRIIASVGVTSDLNDNCSFTAEARTGLRNKQNVPAATLYQITDQAEGDNGIFISTFYSTAKFDTVTLFAGKIPWKAQPVTDLYWDRHLNPIDIHFDYTVAQNSYLKLTTFRPLDAANHTLGHMTIFQYPAKFSTNIGHFSMVPWFVHYRGEQVQYTPKETLFTATFDNQRLLFSGALKPGERQLGTDVGWSIKDLTSEFKDAFSKQKLSNIFEIKRGVLKNVGDYLTQLKYLHVERFSVVGEFIQNASNRFATSHYKGWDLPIRHKVFKNV